jgi:hypothetical protein
MRYSAEWNFEYGYHQKYESVFETALACELEAQGYCLMKKPRVENFVILSL